MAFTVADLLTLPVLTRARPEVVCGDQLEQRPVRWVHTSEIYEIAPLLKGGEVLLTTGLGLVAVTPVARRRYIAALARVGVAALILELGRTFPTLPDDLAAEAQRVGLPLVLLHSVVPFIEVTEVAHARILGNELEQLRSASVVKERLLQALGEARGLVAFTGAIGEVAGCPAALYSRDGELLAGASPEDDPHWATGTRGAAETLEAPIVILGETWGRLVLSAAPTEHLQLVIAAAATLLALEVVRSDSAPVSRNQSGAELLRDMVTGRYASTADLVSRALGVGLVVRPGQRVVAICVRARASSPADSSGMTGRATLIAAREVATRVYGASLVAEHDGDILIGALTRPRELRPTLERFADELAEELRSTLRGGVMVSAGPLVDDIPALVSALPSARETARLAMRLTPSASVVLAADFALYQLLVSLVDDEALERFVTEQLGPLLAHDARTGAGLVMTLDAYLAAGMSKTRTAEMLGIRRQTLYGRLERISTLLGGLDLDNRERRTALDLALVSWRLRLSATRQVRAT